MMKCLKIIVAIMILGVQLANAGESTSADGTKTIYAPLEGTREQYVQPTRDERDLGEMRERADSGELMGMLELSQSIMLNTRVSLLDLPAVNQLLNRALKIPGAESNVAALRASYDGLKSKLEGKSDYAVKYVDIYKFTAAKLIVDPDSIPVPRLTLDYATNFDFLDVIGTTQCSKENVRDQECMKKRLNGMKEDTLALKKYRIAKGWTFKSTTPESLIEAKANKCADAIICIDPATYLMNRTLAGWAKNESDFSADYDGMVSTYWYKPLAATIKEQKALKDAEMKRANDPGVIRLANRERAKTLNTEDAKMAMGVDAALKEIPRCSLLVNSSYDVLTSGGMLIQAKANFLSAVLAKAEQAYCYYGQ